MGETPDPAALASTLAAWDDRHLWHPFTPQSVYRSDDPLTVVRGEGHYLVDVEGRRYLDGVGSLWCNLFGHRRPEIDQAIREQLERIAHATLLGHANDRAILLARRLAGLSPGNLERVFFSDDGSTSVEVAVKMALQYWQQTGGDADRRRTRFLSFSNAYHGDTVGSVSLGGMDLFHARFRPLLFEVVHAPSPDLYRRQEGESRAEAAERFVSGFDDLMDRHGEELAAVVMEAGVQGAGGMVPYPEGFLAHVRERTREHGAYLIVDEVAMGMGRSGRMFACEREGVVPDFLCLAKGLTGGYLPVAATLTTDEVYEGFLGPPEAGRTFFHGHTFTGNPLGCAAALATLDIFEDENILERVRATAGKLAAELSRLAGPSSAAGGAPPDATAEGFATVEGGQGGPGVGDIRQYGLAVGVEVVADRDTRRPFDAARRVGHEICLAAREKGVFLRPLGDVIVLMPPLTITDEEIELLVAAVEHGIRKRIQS